MGKLAAFWNALKAGEQLADSATWKNRQMATNAILTVMALITAFYPGAASHDDLEAVAGGIAAVAGIINAYLTTATTDKIGL